MVGKKAWLVVDLMDNVAKFFTGKNLKDNYLILILLFDIFR